MINKINLRQLETKLPRAPESKNVQEPEKKNFSQVLEGIRTREDIKISKHARARIDSRAIDLNKAGMENLKKALKKAENKGINDALILMDNQAFIVNVKNKVIVTALENSDLEDRVFTNIDGAVII